MNFKFDGSKVYFTSDTHFNHANIIRFCGRPFSDVEEMNETLVSNWNRVVGPDDVVFHLGDFCLGGPQEWDGFLERLNGRIYLIAGNHDLRTLRKGYTGRFEMIAMQMNIMIGKRSIYLSHFPFLCFDGADEGTWQLFGHVHTGRTSFGKDHARLGVLYPTQYDVGVDNNDYTPVPFSRVREIISARKEMSKEH